MKLVQNLGDIAPGPCPALTLQDGKYLCGLVLFPKKWFKSTHSADVLRQAVAIRISSGTGCDSVGENPTSEQEAALDEHTRQEIVEIKNSPERTAKHAWSLKILFNIG